MISDRSENVTLIATNCVCAQKPSYSPEVGIDVELTDIAIGQYSHQFYGGAEGPNPKG